MSQRHPSGFVYPMSLVIRPSMGQQRRHSDDMFAAFASRGKKTNYPAHINCRS
jgi:hypothetical protein